MKYWKTYYITCLKTAPFEIYSITLNQKGLSLSLIDSRTIPLIQNIFR